MRTVLAEDWTLVTNNSKDFRPDPGSKRKSPRYTGVELHAGLICLNTPPNMPESISRATQQLYFMVAISCLPGVPPDLTNRIMVVTPGPEQPATLTENPTVEIYEYPEGN